MSIKRIKGIICLLFALIIVVNPCFVFGETGGNKALPSDAPQTLDDAMSYYQDKRIGVQTGSTQEAVLKEQFPDADHYYYASGPDLVNALLHNKIDAFIFEKTPAVLMCEQNPSMTYYEGLLKPEKMGFIFNKESGKELCSEFNEFLKKMEESGDLEALQEKWLYADDNTKMSVDPATLPNENGILKVVTEAAFPPFEYISNNDIVGYDMELATLFARDGGYAIEINNVKFSTVVTSVTIEKADIGASGLSITEERMKTVLFSDPVFIDGGVLCVRAADENSLSIFGKIGESIEKTFIAEERWKLFVSGLLVTLLITVAAVLAGTALGFLFFSFCRRGNRVALKATGFFSWLIHGMPAVVLLLIMYYIVLGWTALSGTIVAIITFTLLFAFDVTDILIQGNRAIDPGQMEAAYMLGYTEKKAFYKIILPQLVIYTIPAYIGAVVSLLKATAIVGYIAVEDITKISDIISSRTYDAFFPLIVTAIAYFIIAWIPQKLLRKLQYKTDPLLKTEKEDNKAEVKK